MNMKEVNARLRLYAKLAKLGIAHEDCLALRRISMTLHRWHELECGIDGGCVEYDEIPHEPAKAYWLDSRTMRRSPILDRGAGARQRLAKIMSHYPELTAYVQTDPRGCALYILRADDIPEGATIDSCYNRGIAVYK